MPETIVDTQVEAIDRSQCCLCPDGMRLQESLLNHIKQSHRIEGE